MLDQEIISIMHFVLTHSNNPKPYYNKVPQDFVVPAVFFPQPELSSRGDTLREYALEFSWFIKFFHDTDENAYALGFDVITEIMRKRNVVPLLDENGKLAGRGFRLKDPSLRVIADGAAQLFLSWDSRRPYYAPQAIKMMVYHTNFYIKSAFELAVNQVGG